MKFFRNSVLILLIGSAFSSCKKQTCDEGIYTPTPYEFQIPQGLPPIDIFIPEDNPMTVEGVALGRKLFYEPMLSDDNTQSCGSCHRQEYGFAEPQQYSVGVDGSVGTRNAMALVNLAWNPNGYFWDGRAATLEDLVFEPVTNPIEMNTTWPEVEAKLNANSEYRDLFKKAYNIDVVDSVHVSKAIAQFLRTLISGSSDYDRRRLYLDTLTSLQDRGFTVFENPSLGDCFHCHSLDARITINEFSNNGMDLEFQDDGRYLTTGNSLDKGKFRIPTLRNIELTAPYMHDGRFFTLEEVVEHYSEHVKQESPNIDSSMELAAEGGANLSDYDKQALVAFLKSMTDHEFINNPDFSDPN